MNYYEVVPTRVFRAGADILTYQFDNTLAVGTIVTVPLGKSTVPGIITKAVQKPSFATKPITKVLYDTPIPTHLLKAAQWLSSYYLCPLPEVIRSILPTGIEKTRRNQDKPSKPHSRQSKIPINTAQQLAIDQILALDTSTRLLHGITGSGKTNVYLALTEQIIYTGKSVILLLPEIALTSQLVHNFEQHFPGLTVLLHSNQTEAERHRLWQQILDSDQPKIIIGPRSALFAPINQLGAIIVDEAHEPAYYQDQNPKYSALRLATVIAKQTGAFALLGTATPNITDYHLATQQQSIVELDQLAVESSHTSSTQIIDLKSKADFPKHRFLSSTLLKSIQKSLNHHTQTLVFHNRRGSSTMTVCDQCGWAALCPTCLIPLVHHADKFQMTCHTCGTNLPVPTSCPDCHNASIHHKGIGTKLIESELQRLFPRARIARFDGDVTKSQTLNELYSDVRDGAYDILIGTQMLAKGFDFPLLTTLGIVQADALFSLPDFSSVERGYQLLTQAIGRAKRGHQDSEIIIQTYQPDHPIIAFAVATDQLAAYKDLYSHLLKSRQQGHLPPYRHIAKLSLTYKTETAAVKNIRAIRSQLVAPDLFVSQPTPAFHERTPLGYTWQLVLAAKSRSLLLQTISQIHHPNLRIRLDPPTLL